MNNSSLTLPARAVELAASLAFVLLLTFPAFAQVPSQEDLSPEPDPRPAVPRSADFAEARSLLAKQKWPEAAIVLRSVLKTDPGSMSATLGLVRALTYAGRREEAVNVLTQFSARLPKAQRPRLDARVRVIARVFLTNTTFQLYQDGLNLLRTGKYKAARERFEKALYQEPDNAEALLRTAQAQLLEEHDLSGAIERLRLARRLDATEPQIRLWLGRALALRGDSTEGVNELKAAQAAMKSSELAPLWLGEALVASGQRPAAIRMLEESMRDQPMNLMALHLLVRTRLQGASRDRETIWAARKDLQVALSRISKYSSEAATAAQNEGELGLDLRKSGEELKAEFQNLLQQVELRLQESPPAGRGQGTST